MNTRSPADIPPRSPMKPDTTHRRMNPLRALGRAALLIGICATFFPAYWIHRLFIKGTENRRRAALKWMQRWARSCCWAIGYKIRVRGAPPPDGSLITPNHIGYGDVFVLLAAAPCFFVPKAEIARWPFVGTLVRGTEHILSTRRRGARDLASTADGMEDRLKNGFSVCVFLEGGTSNGESVRIFHSSFLQPALHCGAPIVPAAFCWRSTLPGTSVIEHVAFWKNHVFLSHFLRHLGLGGFEVEIVFGEPILAGAQDRKSLAVLLRQRVLEMRNPMNDRALQAEKNPQPEQENADERK